MPAIAQEFEIIQRLFDHAVSRHDVTLGIGDDAAVTRVPAGYELVTTTDALVLGTHFEADADPVSVGHRSLAVNLSDLAAMGAEPCWVSLALHLSEIDEAWIGAFAQGFFRLAGRCDVALIGGDTVRGPLAVTVTAHGIVPEGSAVSRAGARAGDALYVTGFPGSAGFARRHRSEALAARFEFPEPRLEQGIALRGIATAMIDISDGLDSDIRQVLRASRLGAALDLQALPVAPEMSAELGPLATAELALFGGEDYELLFTVPKSGTAQLAEIARDWPMPVTKLGTVATGDDLVWLLDDSVYTPGQLEFRHFA